MASPAAAATSASSARLAPETSTSSGAPDAAPRMTSDLTIAPSSQPTAAAASGAVRGGSAGRGVGGVAGGGGEPVDVRRQAEGDQRVADGAGAAGQVVHAQSRFSYQCSA